MAQANPDVSLFECLQLCDKRNLVLARDDLRDSMGLTAATRNRSLLERAEQLRNVLAHSLQDLVQGSSSEEVIDVVEWVETVVHTSDERVEQKAKNSTKCADVQRGSFSGSTSAYLRSDLLPFLDSY